MKPGKTSSDLDDVFQITGARARRSFDNRGGGKTVEVQGPRKTSEVLAASGAVASVREAFSVQYSVR
jgi:hypothetical protein